MRQASGFALCHLPSVSSSGSPRACLPEFLNSEEYRSFSEIKRTLTSGVAGVTGLEPATSGVTGRRSNQLSYTPNGDSKRFKIPKA